MLKWREHIIIKVFLKSTKKNKTSIINVFGLTMRIIDATKKRIVNLIVERHITVNSLAYNAGMSPSTLKNIIYGSSNNPGLVTLKIICDGLDINVKEFFDCEIFDNLEQEIF